MSIGAVAAAGAAAWALCHARGMNIVCARRLSWCAIHIVVVIGCCACSGLGTPARSSAAATPTFNPPIPAMNVQDTLNPSTAVSADTALIQGVDYGFGFDLVAHKTLPLMIRASGTNLVLQNTVSGAVQAVLPGAFSELRAITISPDGRFVYTGDVAGELAEWDLSTGDRKSLSRETGPLFQIALAANGSAMVTSGRDFTRYYAAPGTLPRSLYATGLGQPQFVLDGRYLIGRDPSLRVIDVATGALVATSNGGSRWSPSWALAPGGKQVIWIGPDDAVFTAALPSLANPRSLATVPGASYLYLSLDGSRLLIDGAKQAVLLDRTGRVVMSYPGARADVVGFSPSGRLFATHNERRLEVHESQTARLVKAFPLDGSPGDISWCGDESCLAASQKMSVVFLNVQSGSVIRAASPQRRISEISFRPDGRGVDLEEHFASHYLIDGLTGTLAGTVPELRLRGEATPVEDLEYSPNGQYYVAGSRGVLELVDLRNGSHRVLVEDVSRYSVRQARFSPDSSRLVALGDRSGTAFIKDIATGRDLIGIDPPKGESYFTAAWSPHGDRLALAGHRELRVVDVMSRADILKVEVPNTTMALAWLDSERLLSGHDRGELLVWSLRPGQLPQPIEGKRNHVQKVAVSSDGRWAAAIGRYYLVELIDTASLKVVRQLRTASGELSDVEWHPCRPLLGVAHGDATFFDVQAGTSLSVTLLGEPESPQMPIVAATRSDGHVGAGVDALPFIWVRHGGPAGQIAPATERRDLQTPSIGQPWFSGCQ
jgi:WD40 repeat protein